MSIQAMKQALVELQRLACDYASHGAAVKLRDAIEAAQKVEPVAEVGTMQVGDKWYRTQGGYLMWEISPPAVPEGWIRAVDEAMVGSHLGVANAYDSYEVSKKKLNDLICWHVQVATDPAVNGGWQLVGYLDGRERFFYVDDPHMQIDHTGMRECYAAPKGVK